MHFSRLFGLLENAIKSQLYRFTTMNLGNPTTRAFSEKRKPSSWGFIFSVFGVVVVERFIVVNRLGFENDPLGTEENGSFLSRGGAVGYLLPRIGGIYYV